MKVGSANASLLHNGKRQAGLPPAYVIIIIYHIKQFSHRRRYVRTNSTYVYSFINGGEQFFDCSSPFYFLVIEFH